MLQQLRAPHRPHVYDICVTRNPETDRKADEKAETRALAQERLELIGEEIVVEPPQDMTRQNSDISIKPSQSTLATSLIRLKSKKRRGT